MGAKKNKEEIETRDKPLKERAEAFEKKIEETFTPVAAAAASVDLLSMDTGDSSSRQAPAAAPSATADLLSFESKDVPAATTDLLSFKGFDSDVPAEPSDFSKGISTLPLPPQLS